MLKCIKNFFTEEDGMGVVEIVIIIAVLVGLALLFRNQISNFAKGLMDKTFNAGNVETNTDVSTDPLNP